MQKIMAWLLIGLLAGVAGAVPGRGFLGDVDGYVMITSEDDIVDPENTILRSELQIYRDYNWGSLVLEPYYYFKNDGMNLQNQSLLLTENLLGLDLILQQTALTRFTGGIGYKYRTKSFGTNDSLIVTKLRIDF
jgi:hypothetical protein